jgi:hypothetical protein
MGMQSVTTDFLLTNREPKVIPGRVVLWQLCCSQPTTPSIACSSDLPLIVFCQSNSTARNANFSLRYQVLSINDITARWP